MFLLYYMETSYTVYTPWAVGRSKRRHTCGAACDCAAGCTQWGHGSVKVLCGCDCIQTYSEIKSSEFHENFQTVFKFYHHHRHHRGSCIQVLDCLNAIR